MEFDPTDKCGFHLPGAGPGVSLNILGCSSPAFELSGFLPVSLTGLVAQGSALLCPGKKNKEQFCSED
jgi:hypothetical protein